jgi:hypothetical protein
MSSRDRFTRIFHSYRYRVGRCNHRVVFSIMGCVMTENTEIPCCGNCNENCDYAGEYHPERYACIKHPRAREYLNREVVAELERKIHENTGYPDEEICEDILKLLKEGVRL